MSDVVIKVENLSKQYRLGTVGTGTISHDLNRAWAKLRGKEDPYLKIGQINDRTKRADSDYVWALRDINFEVRRGEVLGIVGRNGAGKSTLLKILSQITRPTIGSVKMKGRVGSLLEVGTGFHHELTGRENVYINGAILGMRKYEIDKKLDEIIDFAGIERYIDTPVKRYSSGMMVRLGFSVAAHLEPEILIVDEVLAVGDAEFQKKCMGKMSDVSKNEGRTILFVSHNISAVKSLCTKSLIINNGSAVNLGETSEVVAHYLNHSNKENTLTKEFVGISSDDLTVREIKVRSSINNPESGLLDNEGVILTTIVDMHSLNPERFHLTYHLKNELGEVLFSFSNARFGLSLRHGINHLECEIPALFFQSGVYTLNLLVIENKQRIQIQKDDIFSFAIVNGSRQLGSFMGREPGFIRPNFVWRNA